jgi:hypothetical protein
MERGGNWGCGGALRHGLRGGGANTLGYYFVSQSANEPANGVNLGALSTGLLKISVSGGVATPSNAIAGTDYVTPGGSITGTAANVTGTVAVINGGTGAAGALTGLVRGSPAAMTAAELSGDATTSGSNVVTVKGVNGVPLCTGFAPTTGQALEYTTASSPNPCYTAATPGGSTRSWSVTFQGVGQAGVSGFALNLPSESAPVPTNSGGTMPISVLEWPTAQSTYYAWATFLLPAGYTTNAAISYSVESRCNAASCDSTRNNIMTLGLGCSAAAALDAPTIVNASPVNVKNGAAAIQTITTGTLTPNSGGLPACAAGNRVWVRMIVDTNTNSLTGPFDLVSATFSVQGGR